MPIKFQWRQEMKKQTSVLKKILITGVAGNIGSALAEALCRQSTYFVVGVDNLSTGARNKLPANNPDNFRFFKVDVNNHSEISSIFYANKFDYVFHFAAVVGVQRTLANPLMVFEDIEGIKNILLLSKNCDVKRVFYSSSSEVYGEPVCLPQHEETTPLNSRLPYAIVKNLGEAYFRAYYTVHQLPYTIFRFFNTYGPNQSDDFVVPCFINKALRNEPISVYGDGNQTRTFCFIGDNTDTMIGCLERNLFINDVLNVGSDIEFKIFDLAKTIIRICKSKSDIIHLPPLKEGDMSRRNPDISKMKAVLNRPLLSLEEGISKLLFHKLEKKKHESK
jgi:UDP-glucuronate decarboxylase